MRRRLTRKNSSTGKGRTTGFTLIELLVVIAIIAVSDRPVVAGRAGGARGGPPRPVLEQPEADRHRPAQLPRHHRLVPDLASGGRRTTPGVAHGARPACAHSHQLDRDVLPFFEQTPTYNAINFSLPMNGDIPASPAATSG